MLFTITSWTCAISALAAFFYKLPTARRSGGDPAPIALCVYFLCSSLSFLIDLDPVRSVVSEALRYPSITTVITQSAVVVLTAAQQVALVHWSRPRERAGPEARRRVVVFGAALAVLITLFFLLGPLGRYDSPLTAITMHLTKPHYALYMALYISVCAAGQLEVLRLSLRFARLAHRPWLRRGMRIMSAGAALVLVYCGCRFAALIGLGLDMNVDVLHRISWLTGDTGSLFQIIGWTLPAWGIRLSAVRQWCAQYRAHRRLRPLWVALCTAVPTIALAPPRSRLSALLPPRDLAYRLYRTAIEIRDGQLALRPYADAAMVRRQADALRLAADPHSPLGEALLLHAALGNRGAKAYEPAAAPTSFDHSAHDDIAKEIARLTEVADAFVRVRRMKAMNAMETAGARAAPARAPAG